MGPHLERSRVLGGDNIAHLIHHVAEPLNFFRGAEALSAPTHKDQPEVFGTPCHCLHILALVLAATCKYKCAMEATLQIQVCNGSNVANTSVKWMPGGLTACLQPSSLLEKPRLPEGEENYGAWQVRGNL